MRLSNRVIGARPRIGETGIELASPFVSLDVLALIDFDVIKESRGIKNEDPECFSILHVCPPIVAHCRPFDFGTLFAIKVFVKAHQARDSRIP